MTWHALRDKCRQDGAVVTIGSALFWAGLYGVLTGAIIAVGAPALAIDWLLRDPPGCAVEGCVCRRGDA